jgi:hypothetical protein
VQISQQVQIRKGVYISGAQDINLVSRQSTGAI